ncbi:hypothetical protein M0R45_007466 [Rubus argutus]|uniref:Uncharacterized protein n=1 Tax=Rubus argutus TaxID=59490 RepID=A0AAW1XYC5_RUBAR
MVRQKGGGSNPPPPHVSGELSSLEFDFQVHRDETAAKIEELHSSFAYFRREFRAELLKELRHLRPAPLADGGPQNTTLLHFGDLPTMSSPSRVPTSGDTSSSTTLVPDGNRPHNLTSTALSLAHTDVILGYTSEVAMGRVDVPNSLALATTTIAEGVREFMPQNGNLLKNKGVIGGVSSESVNGMQTHYAQSVTGMQTYYAQPTHWGQHTSFGSQPFNAFTGPLYSQNNLMQPQNGYMNQPRLIATDPLLMTYTSPYLTTSASITSNVSLPFAVPAYLQSQMLN